MGVAHLRTICAHASVALAQVQLSLLDRRPLLGGADSLAAFCAERRIVLVAYGVLAGGLLTERWLGRPAPEPASIEVTPESETKPAEPEFQDVAENELPQAPKPEPGPEEPEPEPVPTAKPKKEPMQEPDTDSEAETIAETSPVIPRGIRFDDIEGMIDELLAEEE